MARHLSWVCAALLVLAASIFSITLASAQTGPAAAPTTTVDVRTLPSMASAPIPSFDPEKATNAYLSRISGQARAKSDSYFEGGYWLLLWDALYVIAVSALLLWSRVSARMRDFAEGITRSRFWQAPIYIVQYIVLTTVLTFPMTVYESYFREHAYGLSNQNFLQWSGDFGIEFCVSLLGFTIIGTLIYAAIRAASNIGGRGAPPFRSCSSSSSR